MKLCCAWCWRIYTPADKNWKGDVNHVFCCKGCAEANQLFKELCKLQHCIYIRRFVPRLT